MPGNKGSGRKPQFLCKLDKQLNKMSIKANRIKRIQKLVNTILANGCYSEKNEEKQILDAEDKGKLTKKERKILERSWNLRREEAHNLIEKLDLLLDEIEKNRGEK